MTTITLPRPRNALLDRLRTIQIGIAARGAVSAGLAAKAGGAAAPAGMDWSQWFDHCWVAKGAASLAASYADLVGAQALTTAAAPTLDANGWVCNGSTSYLDSGISIGPDEIGIWSVMVQFVAGSAAAGFYTAVGAYHLNITPNWYAYLVTAANGGGYSYLSAYMTAGNYCVAGLAAYRNGASDGALAGGDQSYTSNLWIGANSYGPGQFYAGTIVAVGVKHAILNATAVAAAKAAMAAL